jgi:hypothetical protein
VGTYFTGSGPDWEPKYPARVPRDKLDQLAMLMDEAGAKIGILAGQTSDSRYRTLPDPAMIRIYDSARGSIHNPRIVLPLESLSVADARDLCGVLGAKR